MVTVVPVAKLNVKASPAGTVNPLRVMLVHFTAFATSSCRDQSKIIFSWIVADTTYQTES